MKLSVTASCRRATFAPIIYNGQLEEAITKASEFGFDAIELHIADPRHVDRKWLKEQLEKEGLAISTIGTGLTYVEERLSFTDPDESVRQKARERLKEHIELAQDLGGAKVIIGTIKGPIRPELGEKTCFDLITQGIEEGLEVAAKKGIEMVVEAINRYESNSLNTVDKVLDFIRRFDSDLIGIHLDTFHMNIEERNIEESICSAGRKLRHMHVVDSNRWYPGSGHVPFDSVIATLKDMGYQEYLAVEALPLPDPDTAARKTHEFLSRLLK